MLAAVGLLVLIGSAVWVRHANKQRETALLRQIPGLLQHPNALFQAGHFADAAREYRVLAVRASQDGNRQLALRALNNLGGALSASFQYSAAAEAYLHAKKISESLRNRSISSALAANLASLYWQLGDEKAARHLAEESLRLTGPADPLRIRAKVLTLVSCLRAKAGETDAALAGFTQAINAADEEGDQDSLAQAWDYLGIAQLDANHLSAASDAFDNAFRLRKLGHLPALAESYQNLSELKLAAGDPASAKVLIDLAIHQAKTPPAPPLWSLYYQRGMVRAALGHEDEALDDFHLAIGAAREWRENVIASDTFRSSSGRGLRPVYTAFIEAAAADPRFSQEAFEAEEDNRAAALTEALTDTTRWRARMPAKYWELLGQLRAAESTRLETNSPGEAKQAQALRQQMTEIESSVIPLSPPGDRTAEKFSPRNTLRGIQGQLMQDDALLSFHLGEHVSWGWAVTSDHFESRRLPGSRDLIAMVRRFRQAVVRSAPTREALGSQLYQTLFGQFSPAIQNKFNWLIAAGDDLSQVPFAALSCRAGHYLIEDHALLEVATVGQIRDTARSLDGPFVGLADGIYNSADPRWQRRPRTWGWGLLAATSGIPDGRLELPRLIGSGREIQRCAHWWGGRKPPVLLTGRAATRQALSNALAEKPSIVHLAAHVLQPVGHPEDALIDLGITKSGNDLLTRDDIANLRVDHSVVVMSGCSSASAGVEAGAGVLGLTRAWILAGARAVVGSRWDIPDDSGELFETFYSSLRANQTRVGWTVPAALRLAQLNMLRSNNWRSDPKYWAAFYVVGKE